MIGLTALLDGLWLEWCLDPGSFRPKEAATLCDDWVDRVIGPRNSPVIFPSSVTSMLFAAGAPAGPAWS